MTRIVSLLPSATEILFTIGAGEHIVTLGDLTGRRANADALVAAVDGNAYVNRPGPRLVDTVEIFAAVLEQPQMNAAAASWV